MALVSLKTNLKSLRYGKDRVGGGSSNQPYIKSKIPDNSSSLDRSGGVDFLLRGGTLTPSRAAKDVSRLTQMFFDFKSPNGPLFIAKQNLLSRTGVKTQASGILNEGAYLPTSTILQAAGNAFGIHLNKQGLDPTKRTGPDVGQRNLFDLLGIRDPLGLPIYSEAVNNNINPNDFDKAKKDNRLVQLANKKLGISLDDIPSPASPVPYSTEILNYPGGPGSILGVGKTTIRRYSNTNEGETKAKTAQPKKKSLYGKTPFKNITPSQTSESITNANTSGSLGLEDSTTGVDNLRNLGYPYLYTNTSQGKDNAAIDPKEKNSFYGKTFFPNITPTQTTKGGVFALGNAYRSNLYTNTNDGLNFSKVGNGIFKGTYYVLDSSTIFKKTKAELSSENTNISDFRTEIPSTQIFAGGKKNILSAAPDYKTKNIEQRVNLGDPGKRNKNTTSYNTGLLDENKKAYGALDRITAMPLYKLNKANHSGERNDLIKFSIGIIDNKKPDQRVYIHFRAFLDSMDDQYTAEWNDFKYMGRGEKFYRYNGFTRTINLGWTVAAQSKEELIPMHQKLNFLASSLAPDYSDNGYMRGNLAVLTVGGYLFEQPGIINSINYGIPTESPWEIGINDLKNGFNSDHTVKEMPHIIKVTGFSFTPIHQFVPRLQQNTYEGTYTDKSGTSNSTPLTTVISKFGVDGKTVKERFIALSRDTTPDASTTNYNPKYDYTWSTAAIADREKRVANLVTRYP